MFVNVRISNKGRSVDLAGREAAAYALVRNRSKINGEDRRGPFHRFHRIMHEERMVASKTNPLGKLSARRRANSEIKSEIAEIMQANPEPMAYREERKANILINLRRVVETLVPATFTVLALRPTSMILGAVVKNGKAAKDVVAAAAVATLVYLFGRYLHYMRKATTEKKAKLLPRDVRATTKKLFDREIQLGI